ncbi:ADP-ribosylation factor family protein [Histomonas meleagridis]|uniref:ADP-ribosylation factor family protein n=1 Tax=Histomonas meleagridis TaxID=135588 RepID=UPI003559B76E|nr:ADP-ribosylation factor family protein [Histomonas meleagridis]KAH0797728.1 ADP-ribosylation factor family protein [Histomonas meleagridis]
MSGTNNSRPLWQQYADNLNGIIFVIDSSDNIRFSTAADELHAFLDLPPIKEKPIPLLVFANKNDIQGSAPVEVIQRELRLENYTAHPTLVKGVCSHFPKEIFSGLEWIVKRHV